MKIDFKIDLGDKKTIAVLTIIVLLLTLVCMYSRNNMQVVPNMKAVKPSAPQKQPLPENVSTGDKKAIMYGRDSCPWCSKQKKEMGEEMKNIQYVSCEKTPTVCREARISALPTWIINGKRHEGYMPKDKVMELMG